VGNETSSARSSPAGVERKLAAILSADVVGYSRLMGADEVGTLRMLTAYRKIIDALIERYRGHIVGTAGDSVLAEFASVVDAVQCAVEIQTRVKAENVHLPAERQMAFRIGINLGDVMVEGGPSMATGSTLPRGYRAWPTRAAFSFRGRSTIKSRTSYP
jgi:class 3 adenylate cyclase